MRVGVAEVPYRVPAPGGTSGAGDRRLLACATASPPPPRLHGDAVAPRLVEPAERPGRGAWTRAGLAAAGQGGLKKAALALLSDGELIRFCRASGSKEMNPIREE